MSTIKVTIQIHNCPEMVGNPDLLMEWDAESRRFALKEARRIFGQDCPVDVSVVEQLDLIPAELLREHNPTLY